MDWEKSRAPSGFLFGRQSLFGVSGAGITLFFKNPRHRFSFLENRNLELMFVKRLRHCWFKIGSEVQRLGVRKPLLGKFLFFELPLGPVTV